MKVSIYGGEAFPVYEIHSADMFDQIEVDEITLEKWKNIFIAFESMQQEIVDKIKEQRKGDQIWPHGIYNGWHL